MVKKDIKKISSRRRIFKNLDDIFQFESEIIETEEHIAWTDKKSSKSYTLNSYYTNPKTDKTIHINPDDKEAVEHFTKLGFVPSWIHYKETISKLPRQLAENPKNFFYFENEPIVFNNKGKTPPSVPYLRVFIESSIGRDNLLHIINNETKLQK